MQIETNIDIEIDQWEARFVDYFSSCNDKLTDASHDLSHFRRVYDIAKKIAVNESAVDPLIILAAAYFHDVVSLPKNHPDSKMSSRLAAAKTKEILEAMNFPHEKIAPVCHAIATHSFSAQLTPETIEAKIIQDADRMESLGTLGILRTFYVSGLMGIELYDPDDLYAARRPLNDKTFALDHFYVKLFKLPDMLQTAGGRSLANKRSDFLKHFVEELDANLKVGSGGAHFTAHTASQAGSQGFKLFHSDDPLALNRQLEVNLVIDQLIQSRNRFPNFITKFLAQFQEELGITNQ